MVEEFLSLAKGVAGHVMETDALLELLYRRVRHQGVCVCVCVECASIISSEIARLT